MSDYIPPELIPNILARLPVEDVLRCTSVCKSWYSLITCPSFASSYLDLSNQEPRVLIKFFKLKNKRFSYCLHRDNQTFDEIGEELDVPSVRPMGHDWRIIDSVNGLVCLYGFYSCDIMLWNPSLRKTLVLPKSRVLSNSQVFYNDEIRFGFGATSNDYKIVKFPDAYKTVSQAEIYELSTGSWRNLKLEKSIGLQGSVSHDITHLNGILHWFGRNRGQVNPDFTNYICSFDLKNEKIATLMVPSCLRHVADDADDADIFLSTFKQSLCLIEFGSDKLCTVWIMKEYGVADSWQNMIVIDEQQHRLTDLLYFRHNGEILFKSFDNRKLVVYDCNNKRVKNIVLFANDLVASIHTYVESLALINGPN